MCGSLHGKAAIVQHRTHLNFNHLSQRWTTGQRLRYHFWMADRRWSCPILGMWQFKAVGLRYYWWEEAILLRFGGFFECTNAFFNLNFETVLLVLVFFSKFVANQIPNVVLDIWHHMFPNSIGSPRCWQLQTKWEGLSIPSICAGALNASSSTAPTTHTEALGSSTPLQRTPLWLTWARYACQKKFLSREWHPCAGQTFQGSTSAPLVLIQLKSLGCNLGMH